MADFSSDMMKARKQWKDIFKVLGWKKTANIVCFCFFLMKTVFKIKVFSDKSWENLSPWGFHKRNPKGKSSGKRRVTQAPQVWYFLKESKRRQQIEKKEEETNNRVDINPNILVIMLNISVLNSMIKRLR